MKPYPYRARALLGDAVVAESDTAARIDKPGEVSELWFPADAVDTGALAGAWRKGEGELDSHVLIEHDRVRFEVVDAGEGEDERDITIKRFPNWGDASDLIEIMDVQPQGGGRYISAFHSDGVRPVVEASQILGQCIIAASRYAPGPPGGDGGAGVSPSCGCASDLRHPTG